MAKLRISYNAPVVLTFAILSVIVQAVSGSIEAGKVCHTLTCDWFTTQGHLGDFRAYVTLFTHIIGHGSWDHLIGNFMLILLLGPILEERYGSLSLTIMILITALISGLVDVALGDRTLGASGIVFMMILLASTANIKQGEIPLTFVAVAVIYLGAEIMKSFEKDNISQLGHILGGVAGAIFGFLGARAKHADTSIKPSAMKAVLGGGAPPPAKPKPSRPAELK